MVFGEGNEIMNSCGKSPVLTQNVSLLLKIIEIHFKGLFQAMTDINLMIT